MGLPFRMAEFVSDEGLGGGDGQHGGGNKGFAKVPLPATASASAFHKMLTELSYGHHLKSDIASISRQCKSVQLPLFAQSPDYLMTPSPYSATHWVQPLEGSLPNECYNGFTAKDLASQYQQYTTLNGGSLVLDTARGELVNASKMTPKEILEAKALAASKSHSEAERRRRERINAHLATLRTLLPSSTKTDKASLLAEVIDQVKILKRQVSEIYEYGPMPTDHDDISVAKVSSAADGGRLVIRASLCCDDRLELMANLKDAIDSMRLRTLKAEISTLEGRIKNVFVVQLREGIVEADEDAFMRRLQKVLRLVIDGPVGGGELSPVSATKRQRGTPFGSPGCT